MGVPRWKRVDGGGDIGCEEGSGEMGGWGVGVGVTAGLGATALGRAVMATVLQRHDAGKGLLMGCCCACRGGTGELWSIGEEELEVGCRLACCWDGSAWMRWRRRRVGASRWAGGSMERRDDGEGWLLLGRGRSGGAGEGSRRWCWRESERIGASAGGAGRKMSGIRAAGGRGSCGWDMR